MVASIIIAGLFAGLIVVSAFKRNFGSAPEYEKYDYSDVQGNKYSIVLRNGLIGDSSYLRNANDSLLESIDWKKSLEKTKGDPVAEYNENSENYPGQRSTGSLLKTIRKNTPDLRHACNRYKAYGKVILRFRIAPSGKILSLYLVGNTTGNRDFALAVLKEANNWGFEAVDQKADDVVTVPFTFSP